MTHWWLARRQRGAKTARARRASLRVESLEERTLLSGLQVVPGPQIPAGLGAAASGSVSFSIDPTLVGIQATITANIATGSVTFNFGGIILTGTGSVVVAHR